jgi:hypothetical protein
MGHTPAPSGRLYMDAWGIPDRLLTGLPVYAPCVVWVAGTDAELEAKFEDVRAALKVRRAYEFHARLLTKRERSTQLPRRFFEQLMICNVAFEGWCAEMVKRKSRLPPQISGKALMHELVVQTFLRMPPDKVDGHTLTFDDQATGKKVSQAARELRSKVNAALNSHGGGCILGRAVEKPAHKCAGVQLADFLAAAIVQPWPECLSVMAPGTIHHWRT